MTYRNVTLTLDGKPLRAGDLDVEFNRFTGEVTRITRREVSDVAGGNRSGKEEGSASAHSVGAASLGRRPLEDHAGPDGGGVSVSISEQDERPEPEPGSAPSTEADG